MTNWACAHCGASNTITALNRMLFERGQYPLKCADCEQYNDELNENSQNDDENSQSLPPAALQNIEVDVIPEPRGVEITVTPKNVYGVIRMYPACWLSQLICDIAGTPTLSNKAIKMAKNAGVRVNRK